MLSTTRQILGEVALERGRQDTIHGGPTHDDIHSAAEWQDVINARLTLAETARTSDSGQTDWRHAMITIAAVAIAAVEALDRGAMAR